MATIIHADRFMWDYPLTGVWTLVYAGVPVAIPYLVAAQWQIAESPPAADPVMRVPRLLSGITIGLRYP